LLPLRFRTKNICRPKHKADYGRNYAVAKLIVVDQALPYFQLIVYKFNDCADDPSFKIQVKNPLSNNSGIVIFSLPNVRLL